MTGTYDPARDVLYWGVGGPRPDFDNSTRKGDNLYSNSIVALQASTGKLLWYFQSTPGDTHDWDAVQVPMIADRAVNGQDGPAAPVGESQWLLLRGRPHHGRLRARRSLRARELGHRARPPRQADSGAPQQ